MNVELRDAGKGKLLLTGHASVSDRWYPVGAAFEEKVRRGAWRRALGEGPDTVLLTDHGGLAYARTRTPSGTPSLRLDESERGLRIEADLDAGAPRVQDLRSIMEHCGLQMSVGMYVKDDVWSQDGRKREIKAASVHRGDVTLCNYGANEAASAAISERAGLSDLERRELKGIRERRMCPEFDVQMLGEIRSGYAAHELAELGAKGEAFGNPDGHWSYPSRTRADYDKAVKMVQLSGSSENAVRRYLMGRAKAEGWPIPTTWERDGGARPTRSMIPVSSVEIERVRRARAIAGERSSIDADKARRAAAIARSR